MTSTDLPILRVYKHEAALCVALALIVGCPSDPSGNESGPGQETETSSDGSGTGDSSVDESGTSDTDDTDDTMGSTPQCSPGTLALGPAQPLGPSPAIRVALFDLDRDGNLDIVAATTTGFELLMGAGDGSFQATDGAGVSDPARGLAFADFDGDGNPDVAVSLGAAARVEVHFGNGDGTLGSDVAAWDIGGVEINSIAAGDFDGDGDADIAIGLDSGGPGFAWGLGDGSFDNDAADYGSGLAAVAAADLDGSGPLDLVLTGFSASEVVVARGDGVGSYPVAGSGRSVVTYDMDGDGVLDIVTANEATVSVLRGLGSGQFDDALDLPIAAEVFRFDVGDFDCDGRGDLAFVGTPANELLVMRGVGEEGIALEPAVSVATATAPVAVAVGDLDGDGVDDVVVAGSDNGDGSGLVMHLAQP